MADIHHWLEPLNTPRDIRKTHRAFAAHILGSIYSSSASVGTGPHYAPVTIVTTGTPEAPVPAVSPEVTAHHPISLQLPNGLRGDKTETFRSPGYVQLPVSVPPCTPELERILLDALVSELNETFMTTLATEYCTMWDGAAGTEQHEDWSSTRFIFVGARHSSRLASAMCEAGARWRISQCQDGVSVKQM
jgi:hypothetical protein